MNTEMSRFLTTAEAAEILRCHPKTLHRWVRGGLIAARKVGRAWLFHPDDIRAVSSDRSATYAEVADELGHSGSVSAPTADRVMWGARGVPVGSPFELTPRR